MIKRTLLEMIALSIFLFSGCNLISDDDIIPAIYIKLTSSKTIFTSTDTITITYEVTGGTGSSKTYWIEDDGVEVEATGGSEQFGPYADSTRHTIVLKVVDGSTIQMDSIIVRSDKLPNTPVDKYGRLKLNGTQLVSEWGEVIQLRGMSTHGLQYFYDNYVNNENFIEALATGWEADVIRLSMYVNEGGYVEEWNNTKQDFKNLIDALIGYAEKHGIYAIIDWHILSPGDPILNEAADTEFFTYMAAKHGSKKHVIFEIANEPNDEGYYDYSDGWSQEPLGYHVGWTSHLRPYAERISKLIRNYSDNIIIMGTPNYGSAPSSVIGNLVSYPNVMYSMHFYAASHKESYRNNVRTAIAAGIPIFVTEFGSQNYAGEEANDWVETGLWMDLLDSLQISWCNWNLSDDGRSGAVYTKWEWPTTVAGYSDTSNMKEAGQWVFDKIKNR